VRQTGFTYRFLTALMLIIACVAAPATAQVIGTVSSPDSDKATATYTFPDSATIDSIYRTLTPETYTLSPENSRVAMKRNGGAPIKEITVHRPDPEKATWLALIIPGGGQIYNRKYWKLPIVYGGFVGCLYAYNWNGQMYKDYRQAYLDIMDSDPNTDSFKDFFRPGYNFEANKEYLKSVFKKRKDRYRRWRDLSIFSFIGVYAISVIDAYVDAQLAGFDITEDINLSIEPKRIRGNGEFLQEDYYGLNFNITF
jgi:hypothetical protein